MSEMTTTPPLADVIKELRELWSNGYTHNVESTTLLWLLTAAEKAERYERSLVECRTDYQNARDACASLAFTSDSYPTRLLAHERCHSIDLRINEINQALAYEPQALAPEQEGVKG